MASRAYAYGSHMSVTNAKEFLKATTLRAQQAATDLGTGCFCEGGLLANHHDCNQRERLIIKHTSRV